MIELAGYTLKKAGELAQNHINEAKKFASDDAKSCENYLKAARIAVIGLEKECDQILVQAENCDLNKPEQVENLRLRIDNYLYTDLLRFELNDAIGGLKECREGLQKNANQYLQWPWVKKNRQEAVAKFTSLLEELENYLNRLNGLVYNHVGMDGCSGVCVEELYRIRYYLTDEVNKDTAKEKIVQFVNDVRKNKSTDRNSLMETTRRIEGITNKLIREFR